MRYFWKTIKYVLLGALAIMLAALVYVLWSSRDPSSMARLAVTPEALAAAEASDDGLSVLSYKGFDDRTYSQDGGIGVSRVTRLVDLDQFQLLVRYNDSYLKTVEETRAPVDYDPTERFVFTLQDDLGHVYADYRFVTEKTTRHSFVRLIFDGVELAFQYEKDGKSAVDRVGELRLNVYCREDIKDGEYPAAPYCYVYVFGDKAAQYEYPGAAGEIPGDGVTPGLRSGAELTDDRKDKAK